MRQVIEIYGNPVDQSRALRDLAKAQFKLNNSTWRQSSRESIKRLETARNRAETEDAGPIIREEVASYAMDGRMLLGDALKTNSNNYSYTVGRFEAAQMRLDELDDDSGYFNPDQYEINFAAARAIAERYSTHHRRGWRALGRAALIAPLSESRFARHNARLSKENRLAARKRSMSRTAFAAMLVASPDWYIKKESVRLKAAKMVV